MAGNSKTAQQRWSQLRAYHRLAILLLLATVWAVIALSGLHLFLHSSSDPTRGGWQPVSAAGRGPRSLDVGDSADRGYDNAVLEHLNSLLDTVQTTQLSGAQRVQLEDRLQRALLRLEHAVVDMEGMGGHESSAASDTADDNGDSFQDEPPGATGYAAALTQGSAVGASTADEAGVAEGDVRAWHSDWASVGEVLRSNRDAGFPLGSQAGNAAVADEPPEADGGLSRLERTAEEREGTAEGEGWEGLAREAVELEE
jgi:hypothetical protein